MVDNRADRPFIYMITAGELTPATYSDELDQTLSSIEQAGAGGADLIQIREKLLTTKQLLQLARSAVQITRSSGTRLLINDRFDVALASGADGVHLTSRSIPVSKVRRCTSPTFLIGISCHTEGDVLSAVAQEASFAVFGPVFSTPGKGKGLGLEQLSAVCSKAPNFRIAALGGIDADNCRTVIDAGAAGVAGIRSFNDPRSLRDLRENLQLHNG
jgi:thiamine-phosphate pyrophosphorylase